MKKEISVLLFLLLILISLSFISAIPGIPHQFYGNVTVNGEPAPDNNIIEAIIGGDHYLSVTKDGRYGYSQNIFYVEDPNGDRKGKTIEFYVGRKYAGNAIFENARYDRLDFSLITECGDSFCLGEETCSNCPEDCGVCVDPPTINIHSPEAKTYNATKIVLEVSSDQPIIVWLYSLNSDNLITFTPNIIITAQKGENNVTVVGINQAFQSGSGAVSFTVELPVDYCGDGTCNNGETCSTCPSDCGTCSSSSSSSSGGSSSSSSSGGGGGSSSSSSGSGIIITNQTNNTITELSFEQENEEKENGNGEETQETEEQNTSPGILGAVVGLGKRVIDSTLAIIGIVFIVGIIILGLIFSSKRRKRKIE